MIYTTIAAFVIVSVICLYITMQHATKQDKVQYIRLSLSQLLNISVSPCAIGCKDVVLGNDQSVSDNS